jgi:flagellar FliJ protein
MRRFRFRLDRLLAIRRYHEREWELKLAAATLSVLETRRGIADAREGISRSLDPDGGRLESLAVLAAEQYRAGMAARMATLAGLLQTRERSLEKVRDDYLEASRRRKTLDKLKERQGEAWRRAQGRQEIAVQNEIGAAQVSRATAERLAAGTDEGAGDPWAGRE